MTIVENYNRMLTCLEITDYSEWSKWRTRTSREQFADTLRAHQLVPEQHRENYVKKALEMIVEEHTPEQQPSAEILPTIHYPHCSPIIDSPQNRAVAADVIAHLEERLGVYHAEDDELRRQYLRERLEQWRILASSSDC